MVQQVAQPEAPSAYEWGSSELRDFTALLKPGVMSLVVFSGAIGMWMAPGEMHPFMQLLTICCIALGSGASGAINMWFDRDIDAIMKRTQNRPIPAGRMQPDNALWFGIIAALFSVMLLGLATNWLAAGLLASAIGFYVFIYTMWLKRSTAQNIVIGGAAGAFPPVIGWAAMAGTAPLEPWIMFAIIFFWTPPHFWALALYRSDDYKQANVPMMPVTHGILHTKKNMVFYTFLLVAITLAPYFMGYSGLLYASIAGALGVYFIVHSLRVYRSDDTKIAMRMFGYSILYLFVLFGALWVDKLMLNMVLTA